MAPLDKSASAPFLPTPVSAVVGGMAAPGDRLGTAPSFPSPSRRRRSAAGTMDENQEGRVGSAPHGRRSSGLAALSTETTQDTGRNGRRLSNPAIASEPTSPLSLSPTIQVDVQSPGLSAHSRRQRRGSNASDASAVNHLEQPAGEAIQPASPNPLVEVAPPRPRRKSLGGEVYKENIEVKEKRDRSGSDLSQATITSGDTPPDGGSQNNEFAKEALSCGLRWTLEEASLLQSMEMISIKPKVAGQSAVELWVRMLCHTEKKGDMHKLGDRLNSNLGVVLVLGDYSRKGAPWVGLVQPALHLHKTGFNVVFVDIPSFKSDQSKYLKYGPDLVLDTIRKWELTKKPRVLTRGLGGAVFLQAFNKGSDLFGQTHMVYDVLFPRGCGAIFEEDTFQKFASWDITQFWLTYKANGVKDRGVDGGTENVQELLSKIQQNLKQLASKDKEKSLKAWDEVIITEGLGFQGHAEDTTGGAHSAVAFSKDLLASLAFYFTHPPSTHQDTLHRGLVTEKSLQVKRKNQHAAKPIPVVDESMVNDIAETVRLRRLKMERKGMKPRKESGLDDGFPGSPTFSRQTSPAMSMSGISTTFSRQITPGSNEGFPASLTISKQSSPASMGSEWSTITPDSIPQLDSVPQSPTLLSHTEGDSCPKQVDKKKRASSCSAVSTKLEQMGLDSSWEGMCEPKSPGGRSLGGRMKSLASLFNFSSRKTITVGLQA